MNATLIPISFQYRVKHYSEENDFAAVLGLSV